MNRRLERIFQIGEHNFSFSFVQDEKHSGNWGKMSQYGQTIDLASTVVFPHLKAKSPALLKLSEF